MSTWWKIEWYYCWSCVIMCVFFLIPIRLIHQEWFNSMYYFICMAVALHLIKGLRKERRETLASQQGHP